MVEYRGHGLDGMRLIVVEQQDVASCNVLVADVTGQFPGVIKEAVIAVDRPVYESVTFSGKCNEAADRKGPVRRPEQRRQ